MKKQTTIVCATMLTVLIFAGACSKWKTDSMTGATPKAKEKIKLPPKSDSYVVLGETKGIKNFVVKYDDNCYRGGDILSEEGIKYLKKIGIQTIISVTPTALEKQLCSKHDIKLVELEFAKTKGLSKEQIKLFKAIISSQKNCPVYAHCYGGSHRGGILGVAYRIYICNWPKEKAENEFVILGGSLKDDAIMLQSLK
jgi:protein tyrosine phosphatase (PTP) superfamily phosphohydrolase (DUF442 family)